MADKKFPAKNSHDSYQSLLAHICDKGPIARATIAKTDGIYDKLTNTALYTGTHKNRFDDNGIGRGAEGRVQITGQIAMNKIVNRDTNAAVAHNTFSGPAPTPLQKKRPIGQSTESIVKVVAKKQDHHTSNGSLAQQKPMQKSTSKSSTNISSSNSNISGSKGSVFDRLTNVQGYTGSHKHRFNEDGSGKGVSGRDLPSKGSAPGAYRGGDVKDLSQILRS